MTILSGRGSGRASGFVFGTVDGVAARIVMGSSLVLPIVRAVGDPPVTAPVGFYIAVGVLGSMISRSVTALVWMDLGSPLSKRGLFVPPS